MSFLKIWYFYILGNIMNFYKNMSSQTKMLNSITRKPKGFEPGKYSFMSNIWFLIFIFVEPTWINFFKFMKFPIFQVQRGDRWETKTRTRCEFTSPFHGRRTKRNGWIKKATAGKQINNTSYLHWILIMHIIKSS